MKVSKMHLHAGKRGRRRRRRRGGDKSGHRRNVSKQVRGTYQLERAEGGAS
jgi:hypothetical protein